MDDGRNSRLEGSSLMDDGRNNRLEGSSQEVEEKGILVSDRGYWQEEETSWIVCKDDSGQL